MSKSPFSPDERYPPIANYGLIGDMHSCALVSKSGSIDWLCFPRFDDASVFGRILDWDKAGFCRLAPAGVRNVQRRYLPDTNVLEATFETDTGRAVLTDFMPVVPTSPRPGPHDVMPRRQVLRDLQCVSGWIRFEFVCQPRFDYGTIVPHAMLLGPNLGLAHGGKDAVSIFCTAPLEVRDDGFFCAGSLLEGQRVCAAISYEHSHHHLVEDLDEGALVGRLEETVAFWREWAERCTYEGEYRDDVVRSALTLKALTYAPSGALIASPTTSLPEVIGGVRNWDYRYSWIRDSTFALYALFILGYREEADEFMRWMEWSTLGRARDLQVVYGITGERRLWEMEISELEGYRRSRPVRIGNAAHTQLQLDVYGEILDSAHLYREFGGEISSEYWAYIQRVTSFVLDHWREPDDGIWEARSGRQHYVFSKVMCWVALDRAIKAADALGLPGDVAEWKRVRRRLREEILLRGYDEERGAFVQAFDSKALDASVLLLPLVGFIPATDPRMRSTIETIERELATPEGLVYRYRGVDDGLGGEEGAFLVCSFWLADNLVFLGRKQEARALFERLRSLRNDLGLYSEQVDPATGEMLGNFPQALTHLGMINTAVQLSAKPRLPHYP
ncbi:MAG TPA: glycoside hydrolase family 15 protein [Dehalococcoidia bacterium]|nr:glycoside hydrolase family 15 protein [Dehalococcoidia bacterium]